MRETAYASLHHCEGSKDGKAMGYVCMGGWVGGWVICDTGATGMEGRPSVVPGWSSEWRCWKGFGPRPEKQAVAPAGHVKAFKACVLFVIFDVLFLKLSHG